MKRADLASAIGKELAGANDAGRELVEIFRGGSFTEDFPILREILHRSDLGLRLDLGDLVLEQRSCQDRMFAKCKFAGGRMQRHGELLCLTVEPF